MTTPLHVIIPSRGLESMLKTCLQFLERALTEAGEVDQAVITLVDNASQPAYAESEWRGFERMRVNLLRFETHQPFAVCCNRAIQAIPCERLFLLNNDVQLHSDTFRSLAGLMERHPGAGIFGIRMIFPDGTLQHAGVVMGNDDFGPRHIHRQRPSALVSRIPCRCQAVTGAGMMIRMPVYQALNGFDESYPFGLEDVDFCLRAGQQGWQIYCDQACDSLHYESRTPGREQLNVPSHRLFMERWRGRYTVDASSLSDFGSAKARRLLIKGGG